MEGSPGAAREPRVYGKRTQSRKSVGGTTMPWEIA